MICVRTWMALALAGTLAACGGGGGGGVGDPPPPATGIEEIPAQALASLDAFSRWMFGEATARPDDKAEPLRLGNAMPPESDTTEPVALR